MPFRSSYKDLPNSILKAIEANPNLQLPSGKFVITVGHDTSNIVLKSITNKEEEEYWSNEARQNENIYFVKFGPKKGKEF